MDLKPLNLPQVNGLTERASALTAEAAISSERFHGSKPPEYILEQEKPWHMAAALMFAAGSVTINEVAEAFGVSRPTVRNLLRQPWFQERVTRHMVQHGARDVIALFKAEAYNSLITLIDIRDDPKVGPAVRSTNARDILDRALGKPIQRVEQTSLPTSNDPVAEVKRLEEENNRRKDSLGLTPPE